MKNNRIIINIIRKHPKIKAIIKLYYAFVGDIFYKFLYTTKNKSILNEKLFINKNAFFGYYDKTPINNSKTHLIAHHKSKYKY